MTKFLLGLLAALAFSASAAPVAKQGDDTVTLLNEPCPEAILAIAKERGVPEDMEQRLGKGFFNGKHFQLCWTPLGDGRIGLIYEDGDTGAVPMRMFHDDPGT